MALSRLPDSAAYREWWLRCVSRSGTITQCRPSSAPTTPRTTGRPPGIGRLGTRLLEMAENVVYAGIAAFLVGTALVCLVLAGKTSWGLASDFSEQPILDLLDILLLVFIVVELLFAVRSTVEKRELLAEPFLLVGIIASIKEIVVLSVEAAKEVGNGARVPRPDHRDRGARRPGAPAGRDVVPAPAQGAGARRGGQRTAGARSVGWTDRQSGGAEPTRLRPSPHLLQHSDNPVDRRESGASARADARSAPRSQKSRCTTATASADGGEWIMGHLPRRPSRRGPACAVCGRRRPRHRTRLGRGIGGRGRPGGEPSRRDEGDRDGDDDQRHDGEPVGAQRSGSPAAPR